MIEINLLPEELKQLRAQRIRERKFPINLILLGVNAVLFCLLLIVSAVSVARIASLRVLDTRLKGLAPEQQKIMSLITSINELKSKNAFFNQIAPEDFLWSEILNRLSERLVPGIWFRKMTLPEERMPAVVAGKTGEALPARALKITATAIAVTGDEMTIINECIKQLKNDPVMSRYFKKIELETVMRRQIASVDVMDFTLVCVLQESVR